MVIPLRITLQYLAEKLAGVTFGVCGDLFGGAGGDDLSSRRASFGAHVDYVVGGFDHVEVVFDNDHRVTTFDQ